MKRFLLFLVVGLSIVAGLGHATAADEFKPEEGFISLFNGKDLTGWVYRGSKESLEAQTATADGRIAVEDGVIVMREKDKNGKGGIKVLETKKEYTKGFHLKLQFQASLKSDSGVYVRGPQLQVRDFIRRNEHKHLTKFVNDGWNSLDIIVRDNVLTTVVNDRAIKPADELTLEVKNGMLKATLNGKTVDAKSVHVRRGSSAECLCNGEPLEVMINLPVKGPIGLQAETGKFAFRHVRIKELD